MDTSSERNRRARAGAAPRCAGLRRSPTALPRGLSSRGSIRRAGSCRRTAPSAWERSRRRGITDAAGGGPVITMDALAGPAIPAVPTCAGVSEGVRGGGATASTAASTSASSGARAVALARGRTSGVLAISSRSTSSSVARRGHALARHLVDVSTRRPPRCVFLRSRRSSPRHHARPLRRRASASPTWTTSPAAHEAQPRHAS